MSNVAGGAQAQANKAGQRNPLAAIGIGLGVGFLLGIMLSGGRSH